MLPTRTPVRKERSGRGERIRTFDLCVPNAALYQAEPHPAYQAREGNPHAHRRQGWEAEDPKKAGD
jgi:hypothetical protein